MTTTVRAYKGLMTKRSQVALAWLEESTQRLQHLKEESTQQEQVKEFTMTVARCDEYLELLEASLTKLTEAFDKLQDTTDEEEDQLDKHAEIAQETIMKLYAHKSNTKQMLQEITTAATLRTSGTDHQCSAAESIEKREDGYYVRLPWKENHPELPDNKALAMKRLAKILEIYQKDPKTLQAYDNIFKEQQEKGIIEEVTSKEFCSNDKTFCNAIDEADKMKSTSPKVLGIVWNSETDKFIIKGSMTTLKGKDTKRTVTQQLASVYDPMGFLVPLLLPAKIFMQSLWKEGLDWDTPLPAQLRDQWHQITSEIATFYKEVNRRILSKSDGYRLVVFTDASQYAIAACAYLTSQEESNIIMAKSKLPSIKTSMTIPKLEMNALTMGVRMSRFICEMLEPSCKIKEVILYTDSDIVLGWIRTPPSRQSAGILVTNRLSEIRRISNDLRSQSTTCLFGHVSTAENPADCGTRALSAEALQNHIWWTGPEFTNKPDHSKLSTVADFEQSTMMSVEAVTLNSSEEVSKDEVVDLSRHSTLEKAQRVLVYALRFINRSLSHFPHERRLALQQHIPALKEISPSQTITGIEMHESRMCLIRDHQKNYVNEHQIKSQKELNIRQDEKGILRCYGRLQQADVPVTAKTPIYIAPKTMFPQLHHILETNVFTALRKQSG
ncbi:unnamed protein product [Cylicocyclus nassatus]|uniref:Pao retrotransposon peptidase n=1 Tax=Cylicocyclus nassatus TaxID=53992 RepID=A0AA36GZ59_CYLNA|nr:unnamed protein product [Cylicocyclus nassatus]